MRQNEDKAHCAKNNAAKLYVLLTSKMRFKTNNLLNVS